LFEEKESGKQFITITTHLTYHGIADIANMLRVQDAEEVVALKAELETKYAGVPMMIMGDMNCTVSSEPYKVLTEAGFRNAKDKAAACVNSSFRTSHSVGSAPTTGNGIDHALVLGEGLNIRMHQTYLSQNVFDMSDHIPVGIDFTFQ
jgi:endonuclease/exonuclease/phosphatase family metal-dependent hydrolase